MITYYKKNDIRLRFNFAKQAAQEQKSYYIEHPQLLVSSVFVVYYSKANPDQIIAKSELKDSNLVGLKDWHGFKKKMEKQGFDKYGAENTKTILTRIAKMYDLEDNLILTPKAHCIKCPFQIK